MNVRPTCMYVAIMQFAIIQTGHSHAHVKLDSLEIHQCTVA